MLSNGTQLVNANDLYRPLRREDTAEYQAVKHLAGAAIAVRQAAKRYNVPSPTISRWVAAGLIKRLSGPTERGKPVLIDEADVAYCASVYHANPGQGKRIFNQDGMPYKSSE